MAPFKKGAPKLGAPTPTPPALLSQSQRLQGFGVAPSICAKAQEQSFPFTPRGAPPLRKQAKNFPVRSTCLSAKHNNRICDLACECQVAKQSWLSMRTATLWGCGFARVWSGQRLFCFFFGHKKEERKAVAKESTPKEL